MISDGFSVNDPAYRMASSLVAQSPHPTDFAVLKRATKFRQDVLLTPDQGGVVPAEHSLVTFRLTGPNGVTRTYTVTVTAAMPTRPDISTALAALINADVSGWGTAGSNELGVTVVGDDVRLYAAVGSTGEIWYYSVLGNLLLANVTADPGLAADLGAINTFGTVDYYVISLDSAGQAEIEAAATWIESRHKVLVQATQDSAVWSASAADVASVLAAANRTRSPLLAHHEQHTYPAVAWAARNLIFEPGRNTWAYTPTLSGPSASPFTAAQEDFIEGKSANHYTSVAGLALTAFGTVPSGEYIDIIVLIDWTVARIQEEIIRIKANAPKVPLTDKGIATLKAGCLSVIRRQMFDDDSGGFEKDTEVWSAPRKADIPAADLIARRVPDCSLTVNITGAIHSAILNVALVLE
jgi:hypothetical protein